MQTHALSRRFIPLLCLLLASSCAMAASKVRVDKLEGALPRCQSFGWLAAPGDATSLTEQRVRTEVMQALKAKGYTESADKPDCRITYHFSASDQQKKSGPSVGVGAGGGSGGIGGGIGISLPIGRKKQAGTFTLDVIDATRSAQVWSGSLDTRTESAELTEKEAKAVVEKILAEYPDRAPAN